MNQRDTICFVKAVIFMIFCLLAFSSGANGDSDYDTIRGNVLTTEVQQIHTGAILTTTTGGLAAIYPVNLPGINNPSCISCKTGFDSYFFSQRFISLQKSRETIIPLLWVSYYSLAATADQDDLPDLS